MGEPITRAHYNVWLSEHLQQRRSQFSSQQKVGYSICQNHRSIFNVSLYCIVLQEETPVSEDGAKESPNAKGNQDFSEGGFSKPLSPAMSEGGSQAGDDGYGGSMRDGPDSAGL